MDVIKFIREDENKTKWVKRNIIYILSYQLTFSFLSLIFCFFVVAKDISTMDV